MLLSVMEVINTKMSTTTKQRFLVKWTAVEGTMSFNYMASCKVSWLMLIFSWPPLWPPFSTIMDLFFPHRRKTHEVQGQSRPRLPRVALKHPGCVESAGIACLRDRNRSVPFFGSWRCGQDVEMWGFDLRYVRWQGNMVEKLKAWKMWQITCGLECWNYVGRKMWTRAIVGIVESLWKEQTSVFLVESMPFVGARIPTNTQLVTQSWNRSSLLPFTPVHPTFSFQILEHHFSLMFCFPYVAQLTKKHVHDPCRTKKNIPQQCKTIINDITDLYNIDYRR